MEIDERRLTTVTCERCGKSEVRQRNRGPVCSPCKAEVRAIARRISDAESKTVKRAMARAGRPPGRLNDQPRARATYEMDVHEWLRLKAAKAAGLAYGGLVRVDDAALVNDYSEQL